jgi:vancomycin resistance protein YoaR
MAEEAKITVFKKGSKKPDNKLKIILIVTAAVLVVGLGVAAVLLLGSTGTANIERIIEFNTVVQGVSVHGIDISGMTQEQAHEATQNIETDIMGGTQLQFDIGGVGTTLDAPTVGLTTDYEDIIAQAISFGRTGDFAQRTADIEAAKGGKDFAVSVNADEASVKAALIALDTTINVAAQDASYVFMPNGYFADGTAYDPATYDATKGEPQLVKVAEEEKPNKLRYEYWQNKKYIENYIPKNADISRFLYSPEQRGLKTDTDALAALILEAVESGDLSAVITAPTTVTEPTVTLDQVKAQTQLVASWTSSYSNHDNANRIKNVEKMLGIVNSTVLMPGVEWSVNDTAGPRKVSLGWFEAAGISGGAYVSDPGGGVCQVSSTLYNACIRSGVEITDYTHHSIISDYIPIGLDATISTGSPDLKLKNNNPTPMYIVTYMNKEEQNVTVEIYGTPVVDAKHGDVILTYYSKRGGTAETPPNEYYYNFAAAPDGTVIAPGASYEYRVARGATSATSYIRILDLQGNMLEEKQYDKCTYRSYTGQIYVNGPDPAVPVVDPNAPPVDPNAPVTTP